MTHAPRGLSPLAERLLASTRRSRRVSPASAGPGRARPLRHPSRLPKQHGQDGLAPGGRFAEHSSFATVVAKSPEREQRTKEKSPVLPGLFRLLRGEDL